jgi:cell fate (sporulation/competence/biofilm development) regulator YmcA (YheA/YmcA/DUF963 family)
MECDKMEKEYILTHLTSKITELESIKKYIHDESTLAVINGKIETLTEIMEIVKKAPVPFDMI